MPLGPTSFQRSPIEFQKDRTPVISQGNARCWQPSSRRSKMPWYAMINPLEPCKLRCFKHGCAKPLPLQHWLISWCYYFPCLTILHVFFLRTTPFPRISVVVSQNYTYHIPKKHHFLCCCCCFWLFSKLKLYWLVGSHLGSCCYHGHGRYCPNVLSLRLGSLETWNKSLMAEIRDQQLWLVVYPPGNFLGWYVSSLEGKPPLFFFPGFIHPRFRSSEHSMIVFPL